MWNVWGVLEQNLLESTSTVTKGLYVTECFERDLKAFLAGWLAGHVWPPLLCVFAKCSMKRLLDQSDMNIGLHVRQSSNFL